MSTPSVAGALHALDSSARAVGSWLGVDGPPLLWERADILGIEPQGVVSAGGTCRLMPARDGRWVAINLARPSDIELLAAWMESEWDGPVWDAVERALSSMSADRAVDRAQLLGIPAAVAVAAPPLPSAASRLGPASTGSFHLDCYRVLDLSAMWAGPLCARLLGELGATVTKVELRDRPDGARAGPPDFWRALNGTKHEVVVDEPSALAELVNEADVVVTSARPRALEQLGLELALRVAEHGLVWVAITGYGLLDAWRDRVAFGDDAGVAGGLAVAAGGMDAPVFVGDAPADPLSGLTAAARAVQALEWDRGSIIDIALSDVIARAIASQYDPSIDQEVA